LVLCWCSELSTSDSSVVHEQGAIHNADVARLKGKRFLIFSAPAWLSLPAPISRGTSGAIKFQTAKTND
jgi:hypothetical protein